MRKITFLVLLFFPLYIFSQNTVTGSYSLNNNTSFPSAVGFGNGNCGNGNTTTITINGDLNLNGRTLELRNVNLIVLGNLNGSGTISSCTNNSTLCIRGVIQNNPTLNVTQNTNCQVPPCTKTWNGSQGSNWNNGANWTPTGIPTINCDVFISNTIPCVIDVTNAVAKSISVTNTASVTVTKDNSIKVKENVTVGTSASFLLENAASLIQIDNSTNIGNITMKRNTNITKMDYVYWSSPVENFNVSQVSPNSSLIYKWLPTVATNLNGFGNWANASNEIMTKGKGYIVRGPNHFSNATSQLFTATFIGTPNNGTITTPITRGNYTGPNYFSGNVKVTEDDDNWNLIGNPYPSAIDVVKFLKANPALDGYVHVWTHSTPISAGNSSPFYGNFTYNYSSTDYIKINATGSSINTFKSVVGAAQGFFVKMLNTTPTATSTATFTNDMRGEQVANNQFFRTTNEVTSTTEDEKHRIWLNLVAPNQLASSTLIGYVTDATDGVDRIFDAESKHKANFEMYSLIGSQSFNIQGKALPFTDNDEISLGYTTNQEGIHTFGLAAVDGVFEGNQTIFLKDLEFGIVHNLKEAPYTFTSVSGRFHNRFVLVFNNETLGNEDFITTNGVTVYTNNTINVTASSNIKSVTVYDVLGRTLETVRNVNNTTVSLNGLAKTQSALVVVIELENNAVLSKKIIF
jgi:hypothetical protein